jgi:hypothetical protein
MNNGSRASFYVSCRRVRKERARTHGKLLAFVRKTCETTELLYLQRGAQIFRDSPLETQRLLLKRELSYVTLAVVNADTLLGDATRRLLEHKALRPTQLKRSFQWRS